MKQKGFACYLLVLPHSLHTGATYLWRGFPLEANFFFRVPKTYQLVEKVGEASVAVSKQYRNTLKTLQNQAFKILIGKQKGALRGFSTGWYIFDTHRRQLT